MRSDIEAAVEILRPCSGRLLLVKEYPDWSRPLRVTLEERGRTRRIMFPRDSQELEVAHASNLPCTVTVAATNPLKRLLGRRRCYQVSPEGGLRAVITGSGRCGTGSVSVYVNGLEFADGVRAWARHETLARHLFEPIRNGDVERVSELCRSFRHHIEVAAHLSLLPAAICTTKIVHLVRDGRRVVQSGMVRGWYQNESGWNRLKPPFPGDAFAQSCQFWVHTNRNLESIAGLRVRLEDLIESPPARLELLRYLELQPSDREFPHAHSGKGSHFDHWSQHQHETFERICGDLMDRYYTGWRNDPLRAPIPGERDA